MVRAKLGKGVLGQIDKAVAHFVANRSSFQILTQTLHDNLVNDDSLSGLIHSSKFRVKDPKHLRAKLKRKAREQLAKGKRFNITAKNLFWKIEDLGGVRLLHLHTKQIASIHPAIMAILRKNKWRVIGRPVAYTWDDESEKFFKSMGISTVRNDSMYTSVHYVVDPNRITRSRCELQVRTLTQEVWGEVSHTINYPTETKSIACREQLRVLARIASGCTRLVDSIFVSYKEYKKRQKKRKTKRSE